MTSSWLKFPCHYREYFVVHFVQLESVDMLLYGSSTHGSRSTAPGKTSLRDGTFCSPTTFFLHREHQFLCALQSDSSRVMALQLNLSSSLFRFQACCVYFAILATSQIVLAWADSNVETRKSCSTTLRGCLLWVATCFTQVLNFTLFYLL